MNGRLLLLLGAGFLVWSSAFVALYSMLSVGCRFGWDGIELFAGITLQRAQLVAIFLVHLAACAALVLALRGPAAASFLGRAAHGASLAALASILLSFVAVFVLSPCL